MIQIYYSLYSSTMEMFRKVPKILKETKILIKSDLETIFGLIVLSFIFFGPIMMGIFLAYFHFTGKYITNVLMTIYFFLFVLFLILSVIIADLIEAWREI